MAHRARLAFVVALAALPGCGSPPGAKVNGRVTCGGKAVQGSVLFSPAGEGAGNTGEAVGAPLNPDGSYELHLKTTGKHRVVVSPTDVVYPVPPGGKDYPCDLKPLERDVKPGDNEIVIELPPHGT